MIPRDFNFICDQKQQDGKAFMVYTIVILWIIIHFSLAKENDKEKKSFQLFRNGTVMTKKESEEEYKTSEV